MDTEEKDKPKIRNRSKKEPTFKCTGCGVNDPELFYKYLTSRCIKCKKAASSHRRDEKFHEKQINEIATLDTDGKIRDILEKLLTFDKVIYGDSVFDFIKDSEKRLSFLEIKNDDNFEYFKETFSKIFDKFDNQQKRIQQLEEQNKLLQDKLELVFDKLKL
jgi:hypothetical protein